MKKLLIVLLTGVFITACNNSAESDTNTDTINLEQNKDRNNRNTTVYDSASGDTSSYERMPNKINDSIPQ